LSETPSQPRPLSDAAQRVQDAIRAKGFANRVIELDHPVKTAQAAADAVGCQAAQIVKSLVFRGETSGKAVLVVASGANRVNTDKLAQIAGEPVAMGNPKFVRAVTGFAIGGIPPVGHAQALQVVIDEDLFTIRDLWAAAGHPNSLFPLTADELAAMTGGTVTNIR
jgi:prolyl-tRNA editing enzyme YbaK/EbsC (Cys-tRNA(Pro) deacylase)